VARPPRCFYTKSISSLKTLKKELLNFKRKINLNTAHDSYEHWREGDHDDLVLATSLAVWFCRRKTKGTRRLKVIR
jgi:hypothetical protein